MSVRAAKIPQTLERRPSSAQYKECEMEGTNLPVNEEDTDDGYTPVETSDRTVVGNLIKYTSDNGWTESGLPVESNKKLAAVAVNKVLQRWQEERVIETIAQKPLPDTDEMNAAIPQIEWDKGPDGKPRPPWQLAHVVYLLDIETCEKLTFVSASIGAKIAVCALWRNPLFDFLTAAPLGRLCPTGKSQPNCLTCVVSASSRSTLKRATIGCAPIWVPAGHSAADTSVA
jgi:hypothetical protein